MPDYIVVGEAKNIEGSTYCFCETCMKQKVLGPTGQKMIEEDPDWILICLDCAAEVEPQIKQIKEALQR